MKKEEDLGFKHLEVEVRNGNVDEAIRKFKMAVQKDGILNLYKEHQRYEKPSVKKRRKQREAVSRKLLTEMREQQMLSGEWELRQKRKEQKRLERVKKKTTAQNEFRTEENV